MEISNNVKTGGMIFGGTLVGALIGYGFRAFKAKRREAELEAGVEAFVKTQDSLRSADMAAHAEVVQELSGKVELNRDLLDEQKQLNKQLQAKLAAAEKSREEAKANFSTAIAQAVEAEEEAKTAYLRGTQDGAKAALAPDPEPLIGKKGAHKRPSTVPTGDGEIVPGVC
jgi:Rad3-related DNA helicase